MLKNYESTKRACFLGYIVQAIVNNFIPLLFLTFRSQYGIPLSKITFLVTFNFGLQLLVDLASARLIDRIGYRLAAVLAHVFSAAGFILLAVLPELFADPFTGLLLAVMIYAVGGGLLEVLISPIVEACPSRNKEASMSLLHSFYCWGHVGVVLLSTLYFSAFGIQNWKYLALLWALLPMVNAVVFTKVPMMNLLEEGDSGLSVKQLLTNRVFWVMVLLMVCAGASEQAVSQWASAFAEQGLGISKTLGDLAGPMIFAGMMGFSRMLYSRFSEKINLQMTILASGILCIGCYLLIALSHWPVLGLLGCGICGFSVGVLWPGIFSIASLELRRGGTMMFAYLALAGDLGCSLGPTLVGGVSGLSGGELKTGILAAVLFPLLLVYGIVLYLKKEEMELV